MHRLIIRALLVVLAVAAIGAGVAGARPSGLNGQIAFGRFNPAIGDMQVYTVNPDGSHVRLVQGATDPGECPAWFADGAHIAVCGSVGEPFGGSRIINPDDGSYRDIGGQDPSLFNPCGWPSPNGELLLCETFGEVDDSVNGIHTIRVSDGGGFTQVTSNPGGDDIPGAWSPNGKSIGFARFDANGYEGYFVVNLNGTGLRRVLPASILTFGASWSPQGNDLVFSTRVTPEMHSSIWVVHSDGSGLHRVDVQPASACGGPFSDPDADGCFGPAWSPDGTKIVFSKGQSGDFDSDLYTVNPDGSGLKQITHLGSAEVANWGTHPLAQ